MSLELHEMAERMSGAARSADGGLLLLAATGSRAYGTNRPGSDFDFRGVYCASLPRLCSMQGPQGSLTTMEPHDTTVYELGHFFKLAAKGNPTALELLWADDFVASADGAWLLSCRSMFLSKRIAATYGGYAMAQLKRFEQGTGGTRGQEHYKREKFKLHTLRLLRVGTHALVTGEVWVRLPQYEIDAIRADVELADDQFLAQAKRYDRALLLAAEASKLPDEPDEAALNKLLYVLRTR